MSDAEQTLSPDDLVQVGWYCAGGHLSHHGVEVGPSFRPDDPCAYGVPMYVVKTTARR